MVSAEAKKVKTISEIDAEIAATKEALANVKGSETEVYARIVGYYRSVRNWNKGKRDEYSHRKMFKYDSNDPHTKAMEEKNKALSQDQYMLNDADSACDCAKNENVSTGIASYEFFARNTCPNCPPVKSYLEQIDIPGKRVDVDTDAGLARAAEMGVCAAPTVIFYDANGNEISRAHNAQDMATLFEPEVCKAAC